MMHEINQDDSVRGPVCGTIDGPDSEYRLTYGTHHSRFHSHEAPHKSLRSDAPDRRPRIPATQMLLRLADANDIAEMCKKPLGKAFKTLLVESNMDAIWSNDRFDAEISATSLLKRLQEPLVVEKVDQLPNPGSPAR